MSTIRRWSVVLLVLASVFAVGCGDDDDDGGTAPPTTGRVVISPEPEGLDAPWAIMGPDSASFSGSGQAELMDRAVGEYTIAWGDVDGHTSPSSTTQSLAAGGTITFTGVYVEDDDPTPPPGFVYVAPGTFTMGSPEDEPGRLDWETQHSVTLTQGFYMSQYEVTEQWWYEIMWGDATTPQLPKRFVSWDMAVQFCNALSLREGLTPAYAINGPDGDATWNPEANGYRLPTEAEWEYACRAGSTTAFANGPLTGSIDCDPIDLNLDAMGWYCGNRDVEDGLAEVGQKQANAWGLYDMHGNLLEWVWDGIREDYENLPSIDPVHNVRLGGPRVIRGGHWYLYARYCRSAVRSYGYPGGGGIDSYNVGFRPARSAP